MDVVFIFVMSLLPFQMLGAGVYTLFQRHGFDGATLFGLFTPALAFGLTLGAWILWENYYVNPSGDEALFLMLTTFIFLPLGMIANLICSLITSFVQSSAARVPAAKPLQLD